jgi:hypothetical protein
MSANMVFVIGLGIFVFIMLLVAVYVAVRRKDSNTFNRYEKLPSAEEQKVMGFMGDGIGEIYAGFAILMVSLSLLSDMIWMAGVFIAIFTPLFVSSKRAYTAPRRHFIANRSSRRGGMMLVLSTLAILGILVLIVGILLYSLFLTGNISEMIRDFVNGFGWALAGGIAAGLWVIIGYIASVGRFYLYALLFGAALSIGLFNGFSLPLLLAGLGGIVLSVGLVILFRFVREYPLQTES